MFLPGFFRAAWPGPFAGWPLVLAALNLAIAGCATLGARPALSPPEISTTLAQLKDQRDRVTSFYSMGTVMLKRWVVESEQANILVVGTKDPFRLKVEVTHPWGGPILHVLLEGDRLRAFSFQESTLYTGPATQEALGVFLPSPPDLPSIWSVLRGYPPLPERGSIAAGPGPRIVWTGEGGDPLETLELLPESLAPARVLFHGSGLEVSFEDMQEKEGVLYAGEVRLKPGNGGQVVIHNQRMVFNTDIPEKVFRLRIPDTHHEVYL